MSDTELKSAEPEKPKSKRSWGKIILALSLAINLLFVGAIVGAGWMRHKGGPGWGGPQNFAQRLLRDLPSEKQKYITDLLKNHRQTLGPKFEQLRAQKREFKKVLRVEPFDVGNVRLAAEKLHLSRQKLGADRTELLIKVLQQLTPDERQKMLESRLFRRLLSSGRPRHKRHWRSKRNRD